MNIDKSELVDKLSSNSKKPFRKNRFILLISSLLVTVTTGSLLWREIQLNKAAKSIHDCLENGNCDTSTPAFKKLIEAKKSLKFFNLESAHLENANLEDANLKSAHLENAHLENAHLERANLKNGNLSIAHLEKAHLEDANLENVNLSNTHLEGANLQGANLHGAHISHDHLKGAYLNLANLEGVNLYNADFEDTYFHRANLSHTYFYRANFKQANLYGANLHGASLIEAQNLTPAQIKSACNWETAIYKGVWSANKSRWVIDEEANQQFIEQLQKDRSSDPETVVDCSEWK